ncbi:MAG: phosphatidylserine/phosphatidylglycerophosphate/cardiolipin synthase family protein [Bacteroidales bacterium]|nr:phosphatidylserine/phosphatidylglycerophosphate/cardiolipin synthase family protein [Bacteroidales bacterium]
MKNKTKKQQKKYVAGTEVTLDEVSLFDDNLELYNNQLKDIAAAKEYVYLETFRFNDDAMGERFKRALTEKARQGVKVRILVDAWGTRQKKSFFDPIINAGGEVRFFKKLIITLNFISDNHRRDHRKILVIDNRIAYIGSANITAYSLSWRELNLRIVDPMARLFQKVFNDNYAIYNRLDLDKLRFKRDINYGQMSIIQEIPSRARQRLARRYEYLINNAKSEVIVETPYFLPSPRLRKALTAAVERGVKVTVISPVKSDVQTADIVRRHTLGFLHESGVEMKFYTPGNLHAKCLMVDGEVFSISSANFDFRSFQHQHELALIGRNSQISSLLANHINNTLQHCIDFNFEEWSKRSRFDRAIEWILFPLRFLM